MEDDLKRVMEEYGDAVYRCAYMYCRNESDAEDITQEVFCRYLEKHPIFQDERHYYFLVYLLYFMLEIMSNNETLTKP